MNNSQRVAVSVKDSTAKLIMGLLVDVGLPFEYRKAPGEAMSAVVSVAQRNLPTLLKVRDVIEDRQSRAQVRSQLKTTAEPPQPKLPQGYSVTCIGAGFAWTKDGEYGPQQCNEVAAVTSAWIHHFETPLNLSR